MTKAEEKAKAKLEAVLSDPGRNNYTCKYAEGTVVLE